MEKDNTIVSGISRVTLRAEWSRGGTTAEQATGLLCLSRGLIGVAARAFTLLEVTLAVAILE